MNRLQFVSAGIHYLIDIQIITLIEKIKCLLVDALRLVHL